MIKKEGEWRVERELQGVLLNGKQCEYEDRWEMGWALCVRKGMEE